MDKSSEYVTLMETQLKNGDADVDALVANGAQANVAAHAAYQKQIDELRAGRDAAQQTFQEIRVATEAAGAKMRAKMEVAWDTMQKALAKVTADLRK